MQRSLEDLGSIIDTLKLPRPSWKELGEEEAVEEGELARRLSILYVIVCIRLKLSMSLRGGGDGGL